MSADRWGPNPMGVSESMVQRAAEVLHENHDEEHDSLGSHSWEEFAPLALRVLTAGLTDTRWEDWG
jgi:hypothetical protein